MWQPLCLKWSVEYNLDTHHLLHNNVLGMTTFAERYIRACTKLYSLHYVPFMTEIYFGLIPGHTFIVGMSCISLLLLLLYHFSVRKGVGTLRQRE